MSQPCPSCKEVQEKIRFEHYHPQGLASLLNKAISERDRWKRLAEFEYAVRAYPENLDLGEGALDAYFRGFNYDEAKKRHGERIK